MDKSKTEQVAQLWQRDRTSSVVLTGWVILRLNFTLKGYVRANIYGPK